ncbi:ATP-binding cassette domain-containing protein [Belnapia sp. T6]|uniref:ATP-binding cassette domain-containing protein n=1 Tax=Belnapia mucosa TaxID=2804532 RepID=A0ABS1V4W3_9PROT|nr:ATP-binding cassette domain-containing protein [Belnapia mucosa]MBL6456706.1 ATP-binding cassette domain-containing protein [Belnapia mucosa]
MTTSMVSSNPLKLRRFGVTPAFVFTLVLLTLGCTIGIFNMVMSTGHLVDGVMETRNIDTIYGLLAVFVTAIILSNLFFYLRLRLLDSVAERFGLALRTEALQAAVRSAVRADIVSGLTVLQDITSVQRFISGGSIASALDIIGGVVCLAFVFYLDTGFGWITSGNILLTLVVAWLIRRAANRKNKDAAADPAMISAEMSGQLLHPDLVRGLGQLPATLVRWHRRYDAALTATQAFDARVSALMELQGLLFSVCSVLIFVHGLLLIIAGTGTIGLMIAAFMMSNHAMGAFGVILGQWEVWQQGTSAWQRLRNLIRDEGAPQLRPIDHDAQIGLVIENVTFWPEGRAKPIIHKLSMTLPPGCVVVIQGRNGVGKSTLLRLVLGLLPPTEGRILLDRQDTHYCDRAEFGMRIGYLPQDIQLFEADIMTNIGRGPNPSPEHVVAAARAAGAHTMIGRLPLGYQTPAGQSAGLSSGEQRLVGLARALYGSPRLLVLDEPEVGLDGNARNALRNGVERARADGGIVLIVSHEAETWLDIADLKLKLEAGGTWSLDPTRPEPAAEQSKEPHLAQPR